MAIQKMDKSQFSNLCKLILVRLYFLGSEEPVPLLFAYAYDYCKFFRIVAHMASLISWKNLFQQVKVARSADSFRDTRFQMIATIELTII